MCVGEGGGGGEGGRGRERSGGEGREELPVVLILHLGLLSHSDSVLFILASFPGSFLLCGNEPGNEANTDPHHTSSFRPVFRGSWLFDNCREERNGREERAGM